MKNTTDDRAGLAPMECSGFTEHEIDCIRAAASAVNRAEHCCLPMADMKILERLGVIEFCPPPEDDDEAEYGYMVTAYGDALAARIRNGDIVPNDHADTRHE